MHITVSSHFQVNLVIGRPLIPINTTFLYGWTGELFSGLQSLVLLRQVWVYRCGVFDATFGEWSCFRRMSQQGMNY